MGMDILVLADFKRMNRDKNPERCCKTLIDQIQRSKIALAGDHAFVPLNICCTELQSTIARDFFAILKRFYVDCKLFR